MRTRVKICGITRREDALVAIDAGADAIGFVFVPKSPRYIPPDQAVTVLAQLPPFVTIVALFADAPPALIEEVLRVLPVDLLQFHGQELPMSCQRYHRPYIKAVHMTDSVDVYTEVQRFPDAAGLLLDTHSELEYGGTGRVFDWTRIPSDLGKPLILAGGLTAENVTEAVQRVRPYAVDVSSGVEGKQKGVKDPERIRAFIAAVHNTL
jgi:phosphoribosylanthranilate isomerase